MRRFDRPGQSLQAACMACQHVSEIHVQDWPTCVQPYFDGCAGDAESYDIPEDVSDMVADMLDDEPEEFEEAQAVTQKLPLVPMNHAQESPSLMEAEPEVVEPTVKPTSGMSPNVRVSVARDGTFQVDFFSGPPSRPPRRAQRNTEASAVARPTPRAVLLARPTMAFTCPSLAARRFCRSCL